jgi:hypothetical protein
MTTIVGMVLVFSSFIILEEYGKVASISGGLLILLVGVWYATNPVVTTERKNFALRHEVDRFLVNVRELYRASGKQSSEDVDKVIAQMHASVDQMRDVAGRHHETS